MVIAQMLGNRQVHEETFGSDGKISEKTWEGMGQEHQDLLGSREAVQKEAQGAHDILHNGLLDVVERITTQIEKSTDFHHHREVDGKQTSKWLLKLKDVETKPVPGKGTDDDVLHSESVQHVQLDGDDTHWFMMLILVLIRTWPELDGQQIWDLSVVATHGLLGAHSDEPLHDGPGDSVESVSIQGHGASMSFHKDITTPSSLKFSLQHADIGKFQAMPDTTWCIKSTCPEWVLLPLLTLPVLNTLIIHMPTIFCNFQTKLTRPTATNSAGSQ